MTLKTMADQFSGPTGHSNRDRRRWKVLGDLVYSSSKQDRADTGSGYDNVEIGRVS
jgi:hypothetical protein